MIANDSVIFGILMVLLWGIFATSKSTHPFWVKFYKVVPALFLCYFLPSLLIWPLHLVDASDSKLYYMASRYLLPASLVLLCSAINLSEVRKLGPKALIMFLTATLSIILGGPFALLITQSFLPQIPIDEGAELWRGLSTVAGSWIGGGANQTAMKEIFTVPDDLFANMLVVDILMANVLLGILFFLVRYNHKIDRWLSADSKPIENLKLKMAQFSRSVERKATLLDYLTIGALGFGATAVAHFFGAQITELLQHHAETLIKWNLHSLLSSFFWLIFIATALGLILSMTKYRSLQGVGSMDIASIFIYILMMTIGMKMNILEIFKYPQLFLIGFIWISFHLLVLLLVARLIRAPFFFVAVGSQANVGGAATAPVVAGAFHPSLTPVGALLAVFGYALGTYGAIICAYLMQWVTLG